MMAKSVTQADLKAIEEDLAWFKQRLSDMEKMIEKLRQALGAQGIVVE